MPEIAFDSHLSFIRTCIAGYVSWQFALIIENIEK
jgi:hypothetical protein